jgi:translation initiation factor IF-1
MDDFYHLNPDNFKKWMRTHGEEFEVSMENNVVGLNVETKFGGKRMIHKMTIESGDAVKVAKEFVELGGVIENVDGDEYLIKVNSGSFYTNKKNVIL